MIRRCAGLIAIGIALFATPVSAQQNVDAAIAARAGDKALKDCLDGSAYVRSYRADAAWAARAASDPKAPAKFNCGMGANWQEVAPTACCAAFDRDKGKKASAWQELQTCGWRDALPKSRKVYEEAARRCLAQTAAKPSTPPQQAQKPTIAAEPTKGADCQCINVYQKTIYQREKLAVCKEVYGAKCLNFEIRITKPWHYDQAKGVCVGSFEYWDTRSDMKPQTYREATYNDRTVDLATARKRCVAVGIAPAPQPAAPQQAQKTQPAPTPKPPAPQQQAQRPQPTPPSHAPQETRRPPEWPVPSWPAPAPAYPPYSGPTQQGQVPLTPPPIPTSPAGPTQQAQVPLMPPPPPIPPGGPVQQTRVPTSDPAAVKALVARVQQSAVDGWKVRPPLKDELKNLKIPGLLVFKDASGDINCEEKGGPGPIKYFGKPHKLRYRLIDNRDTVLRAILNFGYSDAEANAIADTLKLDESRIPPEIRDRSYALWDGMDLYHFLYGTMLLFGTREPSALKVPVAWDPLCPEPRRASSEHSSVRGTINGGGDFIDYRPKAASPSRSLLHLIGGVVPQRAPIPRGYSSVAGEKTTIRVPGGSVQVPESSLAAIDVAPNGITAVAAMAGTVRVYESEAGSVRDIAQGNLAVIIPGKGVSAGVPLPTQAHKKLVEMRQEAEASRRIAQAPTPVRLSEVTPARGVKDGKPVGPGAVFTPEINPIYVWFRLEGVTAATKMRSVWRYLGAGADRTFGEGDFTAPAGAKWADVKYTLAEGKRWPLGEYRVEIFAGERQLAVVPFRVAEAGAQPTIVEARAAHGVRDGKPVGSGAVFKPDAKEIFAWFRVAGIKAPTKLRAIWNYIGAAGEQFIVESAATLTPEVDWGDVRVEQPPGRPWPVGEYRVDLLLGDQKAVSVPFRVVGAAAPTIVVAMPARGVRDGMPVSPGEVFAPNAGTVYVWFRMAGHDAPTALRGVWHYLGGGGDRVIISSEIVMQANQDWGDFQLELPPGRPWPTGEYRVDIFIADKQAASVPFRVAEASAQPAPAAPKIVEAKAARGVTEGGMPVGVTDVFAPDAGRLFVWFRIAGHDRPVKLLSEWRYLGAGKDELLADIEMTGQPGKDGGHFAFELLPGRLWPLGAYRVDILIDGKVAASVSFRVQAPAAKPVAEAAPKIVEAKAARGVTEGGMPVDPTDAFAPDAGPIYIWYRITGNAAPVEIRSIWHYLGGGKDMASEAAGGTQPAGREWGYVGKELAPGVTWPLGEYRVDIMIGGQVAMAVPFRVAAVPAKPIAAPRVTIPEARVARGVKDGKPVDPGAVFPPDVSPLYMWFRVAGNTAPVKVRGEWHFLGGGSDRIIGKAEGELKAGSASANLRRTLAEGKTWAVGDYRADIFVDDKKAASVLFRIAEAPAQPKPAAVSSAGPVTMEGVEALLNELGYQPRRDTRPDGVPFLLFRLDGRDMALALFGCAPGRPCARLMLHTGFRLPQRVQAETLNAWTREHRFVRAYLDEEGDPMLDSDLVAVGAQMTTVREWIAAWRKQVGQFLDQAAKKG